MVLGSKSCLSRAANQVVFLAVIWSHLTASTLSENETSLLGFGCTMNEQCSMKVSNSQCYNGECRCLPNFIPMRADKCLPGAKIGEFCVNDEQCHLVSKYSFCNYIIPRIYGKCECLNGYLAKNDHRCLPEEHIFENKMDEVITTKKAPYHKVSLGKPCDSSGQCRTRDPHSACIKGVCECVSKSSRCNAEFTGCLNDTFQCTSGQCISWYFVCDGLNNCPDGSDEDNCNPKQCPKEAFQCDNGACLSRSVLCNGVQECQDGSDEVDCNKDGSCGHRTFQCDNGRCLPEYVFCNVIRDCEDESDENPQLCAHADTCPSGVFQCNNGHCRSTAILCSGQDGCADNSDEDRCEVCYCDKP
ncbi:uncharacterized protein LOC143245158 [Tachypleus tridentatus]|uniref:uncharacterized protein LOC143245158 n=1 Tax=Tachypleus tridentatus TaxID=6853 RepID=UPI003FD4D17D